MAREWHAARVAGRAVAIRGGGGPERGDRKGTFIVVSLWRPHSSPSEVVALSRSANRIDASDRNDEKWPKSCAEILRAARAPRSRPCGAWSAGGTGTGNRTNAEVLGLAPQALRCRPFGLGVRTGLEDATERQRHGTGALASTISPLQEGPFYSSIVAGFASVRGNALPGGIGVGRPSKK